MKKFISILFVFAIVFALCACGAGSGTPIDGTWPRDYSPSYEEKNSSGSAASDTDYAPKDENDYSQKLIKTHYLTIETLDFDKGTGTIAELVSKYNGYFSSSNVSNSGSRTANYTIRVPSTSLEQFVKEVSGSFNVLSSKLSTDDVTDTYYDLKAQFDSLKQQEARLEQLMTHAETLSELITIDDKLTSVRSSINYVSSRMQYYEKAVDMSFVYITLYETKEYEKMDEPTFFERVGTAIGSGWTAFIAVVGDIFIGLLYAFPFLIIPGVIIGVVLFVYYRNQKKKKNNSTEIK